MKSHFLQFSLALFDLEQIINKLKTQYGKEAGLKPIQILWVYLLSKHPEGMSASMLARSVHVDKALVSRELKLLMELGLVEKQEGPGYKKKVFLSRKGKQKAKLIEKATLEIQNRLHSDISSQELETFYSVLNKLTCGLEQFYQVYSLEQLLSQENSSPEEKSSEERENSSNSH